MSKRKRKGRAINHVWVVIDDIEFPDFEILKGHVVLTDPYEGITEDDVTRAIEVLTNES